MQHIDTKMPEIRRFKGSYTVLQQFLARGYEKSRPRSSIEKRSFEFEVDPFSTFIQCRLPIETLYNRDGDGIF
jgi:hypothetical protein